MATNNSFSTRQVCSYFYKTILDGQDGLTEHFRCRCNIVRKQAPKTGSSNLFDHVLKRHPYFMATMMTCVFEHDGRTDKVLLAIAHLVDDDVTDHSAASHNKFLEGILPFSNHDIGDVIYLVGDNCGDNTKLSDLLCVCVSLSLSLSLIGCASHRLNLAVQKFMANYGTLLGKVQELMRKFRKLNQSAKLRPVLRQAIHWDSIYKMIKRFFAIKVFSDTSDDKIIELMPTRQVENKWRGLQDDLRDFKSASKNFRATIMSRFLMCVIFSTL
ncbi:Ribonuclease H-like domain [Phytophthora cactorum]|nr:Ribonuclease H-like domain [Phytophthora cactorum]